MRTCYKCENKIKPRSWKKSLYNVYSPSGVEYCASCIKDWREKLFELRKEHSRQEEKVFNKWLLDSVELV